MTNMILRKCHAIGERTMDLMFDELQIIKGLEWERKKKKNTQRGGKFF